MRQYSYCITTIQELQTIMSEIDSEKFLMNSKSVLLQIYTANSSLQFLEEMSRTLREKYPDIKMVGTTTCGEIFNGDFHLEKTVLTFTVFEESDIIVKEYSLEALDEEDAGRQLRAAVSNIKNVKGIQIFSASASIDLPKFLNAITSGDEQYPIFGAVAGIYGNFNKRQPKIFANQVYHNGIIAVIFTGDNLTIKIDYGLGWIPLGKEMLITETDGELCIVKIDGLPAVAIYQKYLKVRPDNYFMNKFLPFCLYDILINLDTNNRFKQDGLHQQVNVKKLSNS